MYDEPARSARSWIAKFAHAFRGMKTGVRGQSSFFVHFFAATAVIVAGLVFQVTRVEWCLLSLAIAGVLAAEMFNSALEQLVRAIAQAYDPHVGRALDIGSAAVLIAAFGSVVVGLLIFGPRLLALVGG